MKKALTGVLLLLAPFGLRAQEQTAAPGRTNVAVAFGETSATDVKLVAVNADGTLSPASALTSNVAEATPEPASALPPAPTPAPAANPRYIFGTRDDYRWQLGIGFEFFRFQSSQFNANLIGLNTSLSYYTNSWFAVEGDVITGFSTSTIGTAHSKIFGGLGGFRIGSRRANWEPWLHGLGGGGHLQPQTAAGGRTGVMALAGGGVDYRIHSRLSFRFEGDWVFSQFFSQTQNNFQGIAGAVLHF